MLLACVQLASVVTPEVVVSGGFQIPVCTGVRGYSAHKYLSLVLHLSGPLEYFLSQACLKPHQQVSSPYKRLLSF